MDCQEYCRQLEEIAEEGEGIERVIALSARVLAVRIAEVGDVDELRTVVADELATTRKVLRQLVKATEALVSHQEMAFQYASRKDAQDAQVAASSAADLLRRRLRELIAEREEKEQRAQQQPPQQRGQL